MIFFQLSSYKLLLCGLISPLYWTLSLLGTYSDPNYVLLRIPIEWFYLFMDLGIKTPVTFVLNFVIEFCLIDHRQDQQVYMDYFNLQPDRDDPDRLDFLVFHAIYYILLKRAFLHAWSIRGRKPVPSKPKSREAKKSSHYHKSAEAEITGAKKEVQKKTLKDSARIKRDVVYNSWFHHSCLYGHKERVKEILKDPDFDINSYCATLGLTGLHLACYSGSVPVVQVLLNNSHHRINLWKVYQSGEAKTALHVAAWRGQHEVAALITFHKRFKWRHVEDFEGILLDAVNGGHFDLCNRLYLQNDRHQFKDPSIPVYLKRASAIFTEYSKEKDMRKRIKMYDNLVIYRNFLKTALKQSPASPADDKTETTTKKETELNNPEEEQMGGQEKNSENKARKVKELFECPVCTEEMLGGKVKIYSCSNDHWICSGCLLDPRLTSCPSCREDFLEIKPKRCRRIEEIVKQIF